MISIFNQQKNLKLNKSRSKALVQEVLQYLNVSFQEVCIHFVTKKKICELHEKYFQESTPTDCISFPIDEEHLGEVFVCPQIAIEYALKKKSDPYAETALYIVHGLLHLIGYDDLEEKKRRTMRKMEKKCMRHLYEQALLNLQ